ncbi:E3 ubiquitin-protein ligase-like protein [Emericellopsis cladophorae]|uniref:E3 ubiquitin protein ligase n=1 Tax=Emericellopsis cladophorae TaxID=2686198 RepID=A0A9Q0BF16_9HYPO|nr:E3 ubiquitin-protein ligase-like protein [Emericellopsis cladophorae]KAI6782210.1 E3 ubiquitin-protein ligase-like protein [Emericellopsis cladophorae]
MEDRKRPANSAADELAPPSKRVAVNGSKGKDDAFEMKEEGWVEAYAKGAIYRQMQEYSRRATTAESRLEELHKRSVHHDDHIRIVDAWWLQVLEELEVIANSQIPDATSEDGPPYLSSVTFKDLQEFQTHLQDKGKTIKTKAESLLNKLATSRTEISPEAAQLESKINALLASQKEFLLKLDRLNSEKDKLSEQLNVATLRYFKAEKKLDRARSVQVQKLEQQAFANATTPAPGAGEVADPKEVNNGNTSELLLKYEESTAAATKHKEQIESLLTEVKAAQEENTALKAKRDTWTDEDFIRSDVFKQFKAHSEELINRVNNLEATNRQLREEAEKLQAERSAFRTQLEADANQITQDLETDIVARDQDLARVRSSRDEYMAECTQRKANMEQERAALDQLKELTAAKDDRISALESENARLKENVDADMSGADKVDDVSEEELRTRYKKLQLDFQSINQELPSIEKAYKKMKDLAQKKVMDFAALEERVALLIAEKSKADQKYFAARKDADTRNNEIRSLRLQSSKSAEIIAQLKDVESQNRTLLNNLEKQLFDLKQTNAALTTENKRLETAGMESARRSESLAKQVAELTSMVKSKDASTATFRERSVAQEAEVEKFKVRLDNMQKDRDSWKSKALSNSSEEEDMLRTFALCSICRQNFKNTALKTCGHLFCSGCIESRISNRMRKCPTCSRAFDKMDVMAVHI